LRCENFSHSGRCYIGIQRHEPLVLGEVEPPLDIEHALFDTDVDIVPIDAGHLEDDTQGVL
jgi:hypothetical protein